jgi:hypothetical protein
VNTTAEDHRPPPTSFVTATRTTTATFPLLLQAGQYGDQPGRSRLPFRYYAGDDRQRSAATRLFDPPADTRQFFRDDQDCRRKRKVLLITQTLIRTSMGQPSVRGRAVNGVATAQVTLGSPCDVHADWCGRNRQQQRVWSRAPTGSYGRVALAELLEGAIVTLTGCGSPT